MPQAGRLYPRSTFQDFRSDASGPVQRAFPPRAVSASFGNQFTGLMIKWHQLTVVSEPSSRVDDRIQWKMPHPTVTVDDPYFIFQLFLWNDVPSAMWPVRLGFYLEYWEQGIRWGTLTNPRASSPWTVWNYPSFTNGFNPPVWTNLHNPAIWGPNAVGTAATWGVASWAQQPGFQPYRTRP